MNTWLCGQVATRLRNELIATAHHGLSAPELLLALKGKIARAVPFDGFCAAATDPATTLFTSATVVEGMQEWGCQPSFDNEFLVDDFNKFTDLHRSGRHVSSLEEATFGRPQRSPRHNEINLPMGFSHELRATFSIGASCWGAMNLLRVPSAPAFCGEEMSFIDSIKGHVAEGLRAALRDEPVRTVTSEQTAGVLLFDLHGQLTSATPEARVWLEQITGRTMATAYGIDLPVEAYIVAARARALASGRDGPPARTRVRAHDGRWLTLSATCPRDADGRVGTTALIIEPARSGEVLPLLVAAYELSPREVEVLGLLSQGTTTDEMANRLFISTHTVRDHVKSIFAKIGVSSRGELLSRLFHDHYQPAMQVLH